MALTKQKEKTGSTASSQITSNNSTRNDQCGSDRIAKNPPNQYCMQWQRTLQSHWQHKNNHTHILSQQTQPGIPSREITTEFLLIPVFTYCDTVHVLASHPAQA
jgi:hypothetical protein